MWGHWTLLSNVNNSRHKKTVYTVQIVGALKMLQCLCKHTEMYICYNHTLHMNTYYDY